MYYVKVSWLHDHPDEPVVLYSECDDHGWEIREVELFRDGRPGYASGTESARGSILGVEPIPALDAIAKRAELHPTPITQREFEEIWLPAHSASRDPVKAGF